MKKNVSKNINDFDEKLRNSCLLKSASNVKNLRQTYKRKDMSHIICDGNVAVRQMRDSPEYRDSPAPYS